MSSKEVTENTPMYDKLKLIYDISSGIRARREEHFEKVSAKRRVDEFIRLLYAAKAELEVATSNFNFCTEGELIDYYIFRINAAERRLNYFLALAKTMPIYNKELVRDVIRQISEDNETLYWGRSM